MPGRSAEQGPSRPPPQAARAAEASPRSGEAVGAHSLRQAGADRPQRPNGNEVGSYRATARPSRVEATAVYRHRWSLRVLPPLLSPGRIRLTADEIRPQSESEAAHEFPTENRLAVCEPADRRSRRHRRGHSSGFRSPLSRGRSSGRISTRMRVGRPTCAHCANRDPLARVELVDELLGCGKLLLEYITALACLFFDHG